MCAGMKTLSMAHASWNLLDKTWRGGIVGSLEDFHAWANVCRECCDISVESLYGSCAADSWKFSRGINYSGICRKYTTTPLTSLPQKGGYEKGSFVSRFEPNINNDNQLWSKKLVQLRGGFELNQHEKSIRVTQTLFSEWLLGWSMSINFVTIFWHFGQVVATRQTEFNSHSVQKPFR